MRVYEDTKATVPHATASACSSRRRSGGHPFPLGRAGTDAVPPLLRRIGHYIAPVHATAWSPNR